MQSLFELRMLFREEISLGFIEFTLPLPLSNHENMKCIILILSQRGSLFLFGIWLLYLLNSIYAQAPCYYLNGEVQTANTPCNPGELHSMCCNRNDICLSNGLCFTTRINGLSRGVCWPVLFRWNLVSVAKGPNDDKHCQTSSALPASACANSTSTEIGIGAGVGIPLFFALVASLLFLFRERRLRKQLAIEPGVSNERG